VHLGNNVAIESTQILKAMSVLVVTFLVCFAHGTSEGSSSQLMSEVSLKTMEQVFLRSEKAHATSMEQIMSSMSSEKAWHVLEKNNLTTPALIELSQAHGKQSNLRKAATAPTGYAAVEGARKMLNEMIWVSMSKYDAEIAKCTAYYADQCAAMQACRGQIAASNYVAANSRAKILGAQSTINQMQSDVPAKKQELSKHKIKCADEKKNARARLAIVQGDIAVLTSILKMTDCKSTFVQMEKLSLRHCQDPCTKKSFIMFSQDGLEKKVSKLQSSLSHGLMQDTFKDLFQGIESINSLSLMQLDAQQTPFANKTNFSNPPIPRTMIPRDPCTDAKAGAPSSRQMAKGKGKCSLAKSPDCPRIQERFLLIQSGIKDEAENLLEEIAFMEENCKAVTDTLEAQIQDDLNRQNQAELDLADGTKMEADAGETARQTAREHDQLNGDLKRQMKTCSKNYVNSESELCALKKIRGELYKKLKGGYTAFFQDCVVSKWDPEECSKKCAGGEQKLSRNVMTHPNKGAKCLPLTALKKCNLQPCPVDCMLASWTGWSKCSAQCGGGVQQRLRDVTVAMKNGGRPCDATSQTRACNGQACEKDCELGRWTPWGQCSKDCDGGTQKRQKFIREQAEGEGKCPGRWSSKRLQYKKCNMNRCALEVGAKTLTCKQELDVILLLDGSGSLRQAGWDAEIKTAQLFVDSFASTGAQAQLAVILYSGPRTWGGVYKCFGKNTQKVDLETTCKIKTVTHFTSDMAAVKTKIKALVWPKGSTLTSLALLSAYSELTLGRKHAKSIVVAITDGRPLSYRATGLASRYIRKKARLVWVPVTSNAPLWRIRRWATRRWQENVVAVKTFADLEKPDLVTHLIANICPKPIAYAKYY